MTLLVSRMTERDPRIKSLHVGSAISSAVEPLAIVVKVMKAGQDKHLALSWIMAALLLLLMW